MIFGFDVDGCLANFDAGYIKLLEDITGRTLPRDTGYRSKWKWATTIEGITEAHENEAWRRIAKSKDFWVNLPNEDMVDQRVFDRLLEIEKAHDVYYITNRRVGNGKSQTEAWLADRKLSGSVITTSMKGLACFVTAADVYVDDLPENCTDVVKFRKTANVYLFSQPWNWYFTIREHHGINRVSGWYELFNQERV